MSLYKDNVRATSQRIKRLFLVVQTTEPFCEVEALMEKMKQLQESRDDVKASQEEKATRFEKEKRESMLVCCSGKDSIPWLVTHIVI